MTDLVLELAERGKTLEPRDRSRLVDLLLESLHEPPTAEVESAWAAEIERRLAEYGRGDAQAIDAAAVLAKAHFFVAASEVFRHEPIHRKAR